MTSKSIELPGRTVSGSLVDVSALSFSDETIEAWRTAMSAIVEAERTVDGNADLICIH